MNGLAADVLLMSGALPAEVSVLLATMVLLRVMVLPLLLRMPPPPGGPLLVLPLMVQFVRVKVPGTLGLLPAQMAPP